MRGCSGVACVSRDSVLFHFVKGFSATTIMSTFSSNSNSSARPSTVPLETTTEMAFVCEGDRHKTEAELLEWLRRKTNSEYDNKGFEVIGFQVEALSLESSFGEADNSVGAFFRGRYGMLKARDVLHAKLKLQLVPKHARSEH